MIKIEVILNTDLNKAWEVYTQANFITQWNFANEDWYCSKAENKLENGGKFLNTMAAKDGSMSFDFSGVYNEIIPLEKIAYTLDDGRKAIVLFSKENNTTKVEIEFEPEQSNDAEMQKMGWQAILNNYKTFVEKS